MDIVNDLREYARHADYDCDASMFSDAADEIARLRTEIEALRTGVETCHHSSPSSPVGVDELAKSWEKAALVDVLTEGERAVLRNCTRALRALAQQAAAVGDEGNCDAWRTLWLVLRQTGPVAVPPYDIVSVDWSKCQIEQTVQQLTGAVQLRANLLAAQQEVGAT